MPQMAPISWLFLFIIFSLTFILFNMMNYFTFFYSSEKSNLTFLKTKKSLPWKW